MGRQEDSDERYMSMDLYSEESEIYAEERLYEGRKDGLHFFLDESDDPSWILFFPPVGEGSMETHRINLENPEFAVPEGEWQ